MMRDKRLLAATVALVLLLLAAGARLGWLGQGAGQDPRRDESARGVMFASLPMDRLPSRAPPEASRGIQGSALLPQASLDQQPRRALAFSDVLALLRSKRSNPAAVRFAREALLDPEVKAAWEEFSRTGDALHLIESLEGSSKFEGLVSKYSLAPGFTEAVEDIVNHPSVQPLLVASGSALAREASRGPAVAGDQAASRRAFERSNINARSSESYYRAATGSRASPGATAGQTVERQGLAPGGASLDGRGVHDGAHNARPISAIPSPGQGAFMGSGPYGQGASPGPNVQCRCENVCPPPCEGVGDLAQEPCSLRPCIRTCVPQGCVPGGSSSGSSGSSSGLTIVPPNPNP